MPHASQPAKLDRRLNGMEAWIFDLDNTLYPASSSVFPQIDIRMRQFISETLGLSLDAAHRLQKRYYHEFGTTLRGLMQVNGLKPDEFLAYVHDIDHTVLPPDPQLAETLSRLPGRKIVFTNGSENHAIKVLDQLGLGHNFDGIFDIRAADYIPKPATETYARLVDHHAINPCRAAMFEDIARNLVPAAAIGMTTIWVRPPGLSDAPPVDAATFGRIDHVTDDLTGWLEQAVAALTMPPP
jgi:putative hydrolase of the HAD superfamily